MDESSSCDAGSDRASCAQLRRTVTHNHANARLRRRIISNHGVGDCGKPNVIADGDEFLAAFISFLRLEREGGDLDASCPASVYGANE